MGALPTVGGAGSSFIDLGNTSARSTRWRMPSLYGSRASVATGGTAGSLSGTARPTSVGTPGTAADPNTAGRGADATNSGVRNTLRDALLERYRAGGKPVGARAGLNTALSKRYGTRTTRAGSPVAASGPSKAKPSPIATGSSKTKVKASAFGAGTAKPKAGGRWSGMSPERAAQVRALAKRRTAFSLKTSSNKVRIDNMKIGAMNGMALTGLQVGSKIALGLAGAPVAVASGFGAYGGSGGYGNGKGSYWDNYSNNCWSNWYWDCYWNSWNCWYGWGPWFCWGPSFSRGCSYYYGWNWWGPSYLFWGSGYPSNNTTIIYENEPAPVEVTVIVDGQTEGVEVLVGEGAVVVDGSAPAGVAPVAAAPAQPLSRAAEYYLTLGDQAFADGRFDTAAQLYARAVQYAPGQGILHLILADALFAIGDYSPSAAHLRTALALDPFLVATVFDKHALYTDPADFDRQLATLELFLQEHPLVEDARLLLAFNLLFGGRSAAAVDLLETPFSASLRTTPAGALLLETARSTQFG